MGYKSRHYEFMILSREENCFVCFFNQIKIIGKQDRRKQCIFSIHYLTPKPLKIMNQESLFFVEDV